MSRLLIILGALSTSPAPGQSTAPTRRIDGEVLISFGSGTLTARMTYDHIAADTVESGIRVYLNGELQLTSLTCDVCRSYTVDRRATPVPTIVVALTRPLQPSERVPLKFEYTGPLGEAYDSAHAYLELGLDNFWFPVHPRIGTDRFVYRLFIRTDVGDQRLVSNGRVTRERDGWLVESVVPDIDIDLVLSPSFQSIVYREGGYDLRVVSTNPSQDGAEALLRDIRESLAYLNVLLGAHDPIRQVTAVVRPFSREGQGGYARNGYLVITRTRNTEGQLLHIAHELAHHWWLQADQRHAWLNESFAEYTAMMALRSIKGQHAFATLLDEKKRRSEGLPPVYGFDRTTNPRQSPSVLYNKGPLLLSELETRLGEKGFAAFLQQAAAARVKDTDSLLEVLARVSPREVADAFLRRLTQ
jgi:peptidase M1-like protein